jgi:hypothetical protein
VLRQKRRTTQLGFLTGRYRSPNFVTEAGLADIEAALARFAAHRAALEDDMSAAAASRAILWGRGARARKSQNFR